MNTKFIGVKELRQNMAKITKDAQKKSERIIVMRKNKPIFELRPLLDEDIYKESFVKDIREAVSQAKRGKVHSQENMLKEFGV